MTPSLLRDRLERQKLHPKDAALAPEAIVGWLGAVQSQDFPAASWALGLRSPSLTHQDVGQAYDAGRILRTHVLRPTWHFVTPADIGWMLTLTGRRVQAVVRNYGRTLGLDTSLFARARRVFERELGGGHQRTRDELSRALARARIQATGSVLAMLVMDAELERVICSGARRGKQFTYALFDERVPTRADRPREEALAELATRYFQSHGPAMLRDFAWWSGLTMKDAARAVDMAGLEPLSAPHGPDRVRGVHLLLPNYDEYVVAYKDRGALIDAAHARNLGVFPTSGFPHHVIVDGRMAGMWRRRFTADGARLEVNVREPLLPAQARALRHQAARYGQFVGTPADVVFLEGGRAS